MITTVMTSMMHTLLLQASGKTLSDNIAGLAVRAATLLDTLQYEVMARMSGWFGRISLSLAVVVMVCSFLLLWAEAEVCVVKFFFWTLRLMIFLSLMFWTAPVIETLYEVGQSIAVGDEMPGAQGRSVLAEFYRAQRESFNTSYQQLSEGTFTVKVDGRDFTVKPTNASGDTLLGVIYDSESTIKDLNNRMNDSTWTLPTLYSILNGARVILEIGDVILIILGGVLLMVARVLAPLMIALAIDRRLAHKVTYPFVWGVVVLTVVWPAVSYFIRGLAYLAGNAAMALGDSDPLYVWDYASLTAIRNPLAQPVYTVGFAAMVMIISGLCLWASPYLAYRISMGQVYEGVAGAVSGVIGAMIGAAVEAYSATAAASLSQQAGTLQAQAGYQSTGAEAGATQKAGMLRNSAAYITGKSSAISAAITASGMAQAAGHASMASAYAMFGSNSQMKEGLQGKLAFAARDQQQALNLSQNTNQTQSIRATYEEGLASRSAAASNIRTDADQTYVGSSPAGWLGGGSLAAIQGRDERLTTNQTLQNRMQSIATRRVENQEGLTMRNNAIAGQYADTTARLSRETGDRMAAIAKQQANESSGAAWAGANRAVAGHGAALGLNNRATGIEYAGKMQGAQITREAGVAAAKLQARSSVIANLGSRIARDIEKQMERSF